LSNLTILFQITCTDLHLHKKRKVESIIDDSAAFSGPSTTHVEQKNSHADLSKRGAKFMRRDQFENIETWSERARGIRKEEVSSFAGRFVSQLIDTIQVICRIEDHSYSAIPFTANKTHDKRVGCAAALSFASSENPLEMSGWMSGKLDLPALGIKDKANVAKCYQLFVLSECEDDAVELAIAHPNTENCWVENTVQRVMLRRGDTFCIPPGNVYRLENHSSEVSALLNWTIIKALSVPDARKEQQRSDQSKEPSRVTRQCFDAKRQRTSVCGEVMQSADSVVIPSATDEASSLGLQTKTGGGSGDWCRLEDDLIICMQTAAKDWNFARTVKWLAQLNAKRGRAVTRTELDTRSRYLELCATGRTASRLLDDQIRSMVDVIRNSVTSRLTASD
jgi:hypothetical protein